MPSPGGPASSPLPSNGEHSIAYYKLQYEQLEAELADFQASSRELEAELEKDVEASEKRERQLQEKLEGLGYEVEEWKAKNIAYFDTSFHATIPKAISSYPIDPATASKNGLRKYGFHGLSYAFLTRSVADFLGKPQNETSIIALHLGSGSSACAIQNGKSLDNSMGLTPLDGLPGATRSGSVDPR
ncbi:MAG: hypothetical protein LQ337_008434 [Flavoplaca oasis]|nr:MAG: hypothetical protein LQ337_008434 [Flavoplaca oasis]